MINKLTNKIALFIFLGISILSISGEVLAKNYEVDEYLRKAQEYYRKGDYQSSVAVLADALKKDPSNSEVLKKLSEVQKIMEDKKQQSETQKKSGQISLLDKEAKALYDKGELNDAIQVWSKILAIDPNNEDAAFSIQKAQTRLQLEGDLSEQKEKITEREYSKKVKNIAEEMQKLIEEAKDKMQVDKEKRKQEELDALQKQAIVEKQKKIQEKERTQKKEENFILETFNRGQEFYKLGKYDEAMQEWESILPLLSKDDGLRQTIEGLRSTIAQIKASQTNDVEPPTALQPEVAKVEAVESSREIVAKPEPVKPEVKTEIITSKVESQPSSQNLPVQPEVSKTAEQKTLTREPTGDKLVEEKLKTAQGASNARNKFPLPRFLVIIVLLGIFSAGLFILDPLNRKNRIKKITPKQQEKTAKDFDPSKLEDIFKTKKKEDGFKKDIFKK